MSYCTQCSELMKELEAAQNEAVNSIALLDRALRAICLTRDYVGEDSLPPIEGWEWFDAGTAISKAIPDSEWAKEFRLRVEQFNDRRDLRRKGTNG